MTLPDSILLRPAVLRAVFIIVASFMACYLLGKDANWDIFNYHLYSPHAWLNIGLGEDFMAAGPQRYLNPIGYLPFYWMAQSGWHSLTIAFVLSAIHALALVLVWEIAARHLFKDDPRAVLLCSLSTAMAAASPVFLGMLGGTYLDPTTAVLVLGGLLLACAAIEQERPSLPKLVMAGACLGAAAGLKLTNVVFVVGATIAILPALRFRAGALLAAMQFAAGVALGAVAVCGGWAFELYREFGNPVFPMFNEIFRSPDFPAVKLTLIRFIPATLPDALALPFHMASSHKWIYVENAAADIRFALALVFAAIAVALLVYRKHRANVSLSAIKPATFLVAVFMLVCFPLWEMTSANGRYALPLLLLVAPILVLVMKWVLGTEKWFLGIAIAVLVAQWVAVALGDNPRWDSGAWTTRWIDVEVPARLKERPFGYLSEGTSSNSFVALHLHPDSRLSSMIGVLPIALDMPGGSRIRTFIATHPGKLRSLSKLEVPPDADRTSASAFGKYLRMVDDRYAMWDLRLDTADCEAIKYAVRPEAYAMLVSCALLPGNPRREVLHAEWSQATSVMNRIESACPIIFNPAGFPTNRLGAAWYRHYPNTDSHLRILAGHVYFSRDRFGPFGVDLGSVDDWEQGKQSWHCAPPPPHWKRPPLLVDMGVSQ